MGTTWTDLLCEHLRETREDKLRDIRDRVTADLRKDGGKLLAADVEQGIDDALMIAFRKSTKELLADCLSSVYWSCLNDHMLSPGGSERGVTKKAIASGLAIAESTLSRWQNRETIPDPNKFFVTLLGWRVDAGKIPPYWLPRPDKGSRCVFDSLFVADIARFGIMRTIEQLRVRELSMSPLLMEPIDLTCARLLWRQPEKDSILDRSSGTKNDRTRLQERVLAELKRLVPGELDPQAKVARVEKEWLMAYCLYWFGRPTAIAGKGLAWGAILHEEN
jgi:hypothetical protein